MWLQWFSGLEYFKNFCVSHGESGTWQSLMTCQLVFRRILKKYKFIIRIILLQVTEAHYINKYKHRYKTSEFNYYGI